MMDSAYLYHRALVNLGVISKLETNDKLNTTSSEFFRIESKDSRLLALYRMFRADSRTQTVSSLTTLYKTVKDLVINMKDIQHDVVIKYLNESKTGLTSLRTTYQGDITFMEHMNLLDSQIDQIIKLLDKNV